MGRKEIEGAGDPTKSRSACFERMQPTGDVQGRRAVADGHDAPVFGQIGQEGDHAFEERRDRPAIGVMIGLYRQGKKFGQSPVVIDLVFDKGDRRGR